MTTATRLALFFGGLVVVAAVAAALGALVQPASGSKDDGGAHAMASDTDTGTTVAGESNGLGISDGTYSLAVNRTALSTGLATALEIQIRDNAGDVVTRFDEEAPDVRMHVIVVRRDFAGYQHLHPHIRPDGTFDQELTLPEAGAYRLFADFEIDGEKHVLGADLLAAGSFEIEDLAPVSRRGATGDYIVEVEGSPRARSEAELAFHITRGGDAPKLDPYLGARGHLVALRVGDLAYSHVHPLDDETQGGVVRFATEFHTPGTYRLFLQFNSNSAIHTVPFTVEVGR